MKTVLFLFFGISAVLGNGVYDWMVYDKFDEVIDRMDAVNEFNCAAKSKDELMLPDKTVSDLVKANKLRTSDFQRNYYRNRTTIQQLHQTVLSNAYKYSFLFQRLNQTYNFYDQPSLFYYYLGLTADITSNSGLLNASAVLFDRDSFYPNFLTQVEVNKTVPLFGPRAWRIDDYNDPANYLREPTNNTFQVTDYGAGPYRNYTISAYKINEWYEKWLPDKAGNDATLYDDVSIQILYAASPGVERSDGDSNVNFFGPVQPRLKASIQDQNNELPVRYTRPYFDCGRSNKWIMSASAPVIDRLPRYVYDPNVKGCQKAGIFDNVRSNRRIGVAVADVDFLAIDIDPCGTWYTQKGEPMNSENYFAGIDRCHKESTLCKPLFGFGFRRGGYFCECKPGYRYPEYIQGPYFGVAIESATEEEYKAGFHCLPVGDQYVDRDATISQSDNAGIDRLPGSTSRKKRETESERKRRNVGNAIQGITKYYNANLRFKRRVIAKNQSTLRDMKAHLLKKRRVPTYSEVPEHIRNLMNIDKNGRRIVSRTKRAVEKKLSRKKRMAFNNETLNNVQTNIFDHMKTVNSENCASLPETSLKLPGDAKYGVERKLERFGRIGLRLSDFLSSYLQNIDGEQDYGILKGDKLLKEDQLFSEVISVILAEPDVRGIGLFFDTDKFETLVTNITSTDEKCEGFQTETKRLTKQMFAPYAYQITAKGTNRENFFAVDRTVEDFPYTEKEWFQSIKKRWSYNNAGLLKYTLNPWVRSDVDGVNIRKHEEYPLVWYSAIYESGLWSDPYFDCDGYIKDWIVTYRVPFFGNQGYGTAVEFRGVVAVDIKLDLLDIEQCPSDFFKSNAFMGTANCDFETTYCQIIENQGFQLHEGYRCDCKQGYEYPWNDNGYFYTGDGLELERIRALEGRINKYDRMTCRMSSADSLVLNLYSLIIAMSLLYLLRLV